MARERIIIDPGLGFAKRPEHAALAGLTRLAALDRPILVGASRKSFLREAVGDKPAAGRLWASAAAVTAAVLNGAHRPLVADVPEMVDVVRTADGILDASTRREAPYDWEFTASARRAGR